VNWLALELAEIDRDLVEWNYGEKRGRHAADIHKAPDWQIFRDGCPGGESPSEVGAREQRDQTCGRWR
jgi:probable phosphoglycerate mutase